MNKNICLFGIYDHNYPRNRFVYSGLSLYGEVIECRVNPQEFPGFKKYIELYRKAKKLLKTHRFDFVWVAFPGQTTAILARLIFNIPIIFDAFTSLYDSNVCDRKIYQKLSFCGIRDYILDWVSLRCAHSIITDTRAHAKYFSELFNISIDRMYTLYVGTDLNIFDISKYGQVVNQGDDKVLRLHFHGSYIPLQGADVIVRALAKVSDLNIVCTMIGRGQEKDAVKKTAQDLGITSINFIDRIPYTDLPAYIAQSDVCLGIFGSTLKTHHVIPNKVYEYAGMGKAIITLDTPAIKEIFVPHKNIFLIKESDSDELAQALRTLWHDLTLRRELGRSAYHAITPLCNPQKVVEILSQIKL